MRPGRDPTRRNKKIGTRDHAWRDRAGGSAAFSVPWPRWERRPDAQRWSVKTVEKFDVHDRGVMVATERLLDGYQHRCSPEAIVGVLNELPRDDVDGVGLVVLHQQTRKQQTRDPPGGASGGAIGFVVTSVRSCSSTRWISRIRGTDGAAHPWRRLGSANLSAGGSLGSTLSRMTVATGWR